MRVLWWLVVLLVAGTACAADPGFNRDLSKEIDTYVAGDDAGRPFTEFTDWEWDELLVFHLADMTTERVDEIVGQDVTPWYATGGGLFVYRVEGEVVRYEVLEAKGGICSGVYTPAAYVSSKYACWLRDDNFKHFG
ncbi:MAG: hypothetical protein HOY78_14885 [Saccharothrix sp.]|nr:hypothetical protein [Saccharothrix sp.]